MKLLITTTISLVIYFLINYSIITKHNQAIDNKLNKVSYGQILEQSGTTNTWRKAEAIDEHYTLYPISYIVACGLICLGITSIIALGVNLKRKPTSAQPTNKRVVNEIAYTCTPFVIGAVFVCSAGTLHNCYTSYAERIPEVSANLAETIQNKEVVINYMLEHPQTNYKVTEYNNDNDFTIVAAKPGTYQDKTVTVLGNATPAKKIVVPEIDTTLNAKEVAAINDYNKTKGIAAITPSKNNIVE